MQISSIFKFPKAQNAKIVNYNRVPDRISINHFSIPLLVYMCRSNWQDAVFFILLDCKIMIKVKNQQVVLKDFEEKGLRLSVKREDELHPFLSGNKYRKLKYNLIKAKEQGFTSLLSFGGAYSNHITAFSYAGKKEGFKTIGVIRGDELGRDIKQTLQTNPSLKFAHEQGMRFKFVSREDYRKKEDSDFLDNLRLEFGEFYTIPEGGTNQLAIKGCEEILADEDKEFDYICVSVGTGGTISGLINTAYNGQTVLGFPSLKGVFLEDIIKEKTINKS